MGLDQLDWDRNSWTGTGIAGTTCRTAVRLTIARINPQMAYDLYPPVILPVFSSTCNDKSKLVNSATCTYVHVLNLLTNVQISVMGFIDSSI